MTISYSNFVLNRRSVEFWLCVLIFWEVKGNACVKPSCRCEMVGDNGTSGLFHRFVDCKFLYTFIRKITGEGGPVLKHWMGSAHCLLSPFFFARIIGLLVKS
jgi:hypothetical protein